jgi:hypothetical protein
MNLLKALALGLFIMTAINPASSSSRYEYEGNADLNPGAYRQFMNPSKPFNLTKADDGSVKPMDEGDSDGELNGVEELADLANNIAIDK